MSGKKKWSKYIGYCENDTAYYFACRTSEYILEVSKLSGKLKWIKSKIDADEPFYYDIAAWSAIRKRGISGTDAKRDTIASLLNNASSLQR